MYGGGEGGRAGGGEGGSINGVFLLLSPFIRSW